MRKRSIYLASSWRNPHQQRMVDLLRDSGHDVYDFHHPKPGDNGFQWSDIDPGWQSWSVQMYKDGLQTPRAEHGYLNDWGAMRAADTCVLLLPCGRSAHLEAGYFVGAGKDLFILIYGEVEPELMYKMANGIYGDEDALVKALG